VTHCSGIVESAPCAIAGESSATAMSRAENFLIRFTYSPVLGVFASDI